MKRLVGGLGVVALAIGVLATPTQAQPNPEDVDVAPIIAVLEGFELLLPEGTEVPPGAVLDQVVTGQSWSVGDEVEFFLNGTYVATSIAEQNAEGSATPFFDLEPLGVSIQPGDEVTLAIADGSRVEVHFVRDIDVTEIDVSADTVTGTAQPGSEVWAFVGGESARAAIADAHGVWTTDFSVPGDANEGPVYDLVGGTVIFAIQFDGGGNVSALLRAAEAEKPNKPVTREQIVQVIPDDLPNPDDRNIVCPNTGPGEYAYFLVSGRLEYDVFQTKTPGGSRTRTEGEWVDVTAVHSDDLVLDPDEIDGTRYLVEVDALVITTSERPNGSAVNTFRAKATIIDPVTGEVVDTIDFFTTDRSGVEQFLYNRGNCG